jgi:hypothetical protein
MAGPMSIFPGIATELHGTAKKQKDIFEQRECMMRTFVILAATAAVLALSPTAFAQKPDHGTAEEAKAMLGKTVAALKADKHKTIEMINKGEGGFLDRDLYPFCSSLTDGKVVAIGNPDEKQLIGVETRTLNDPTGTKFGLDLYEAYLKPEGQITEVNYMFARPGSDKRPAPKVSFVTRVGDLGCGVGYYK